MIDPAAVTALQAAMLQGNFADAVLKASVLYQANVNNALLGHLYVSALWQAGRRDEALAETRKLVERFPDRVDVLEKLAQFEWGSDNIERAKELFTQILLMQPGHATASLALGTIMRRMRNYDEALKYFFQAYPSCNAHPLLLNELPLLLEALMVKPIVWDHFITLASVVDSIPTLINLARVARMQGQYPFADAMLYRAQTLDPSNLQPILESARIKLDSQQPDAALALLEPSLPHVTNHKDKAQIQFEIGQAYRAKQDLASARTAYAEAKLADPTYPYSFYYSAAVDMEEGNLAEAETQLTKALTQLAPLADGYFLLSQTYILRRKINPWFQAMAEVDALTAPHARLRQWNAVNRAVGLYLANRLHDAFAQIINNKEIAARPDGQSRYYTVYAKYVHSLVRWRAENQDWFGIGNQDDLIHVIGESHSLSLCFSLIDVNGQKLRCVSHWIPGVKQFHFGAIAGANRFKSAFSEIFGQLPTHGNILITIGEIDTRPDEGLWKQRDKQPLPNLIQETINGYMSYLKMHLEKKPMRTIIIQGPPAPGYSMLEDWGSDQWIEFLEMRRQFQDALSTAVQEAGFQYLDTYTPTVNEDGAGNGEWHIDKYHLKPSFYRNITPWLSSIHQA